MPIRINLLAEAQAEEEVRRKDPVKRAILVGIVLVGLLLVWCSSLQLKAIIAKSELNHLETQIGLRTNEFQQVSESTRKLADVNHKLESLHRLASTRLLYGSLLNTIQQATIGDVRLMRLRTDQSYFLTEATKAKTNADRVIPGRPGTSTEKILLLLDAKDSAVNPGDQVNKYKQLVADAFKSALGTTNEVRLTSLSPPQRGSDGKSFVLFTLECKFPEQTR